MTWRWPFVHRDELSRAHIALDAERAEVRHLQKQLYDAWQQLGVANGKLTALMTHAPAPEAPVKKPDVVTQAIIAKAGGNRKLRKHYSDFVTQQRAAGSEDAEIAARIYAGETDNEGVPG